MVKREGGNDENLPSTGRGGTITFDTENTVLKSILEGFLEREITDNEERKKAPDGGNRLRGGEMDKALQKYAISSTERIAINVEGAEHHFERQYANFAF